MQFHIKCATFLRLASICDYFETDINPEIAEQLKTVRLENINGKTIAIVTNVKTAAIELVAASDALENGVAHVIISETLINQCKFESMFDGWLTINTVPEIAMATATTTSGWSIGDNVCHWFDETPLNDWREWAPHEPITEAVNIMSWNLEYVEALLESSPSGKVIFPEFIDAMKPVILRDRENENWVGLFIPKPHGELVRHPATIPAWWNN